MIMFSHFGTILVCDGRTDRQTDILRQRSPRYVYASHGANKNLTITNRSSGVAKGGQWGQLPPPPAENPELHCILVLHNFTVHGTRHRHAIVN